MDKEEITRMQEELLAMLIDRTVLCADVRKLPKCYGGAPARRKTAGARARKRALYASLTGIRRIRIRLPIRYTRIAA
jgi:hypothetical protein